MLPKHKMTMQNPSPLPSLIQSQAAVYGKRAAMLYRDDELQKWKEISWEDYARTVSRVSASLLELGVGVQENIAVFSQNMPECMFVDFGAYGIRAVTIPFYATASETQVKYMVSDAKIRYIFVGEQYQYDTAYRILKIEQSMRKLIIFGKTIAKRYRSSHPKCRKTTWPTSSTPAERRASARVSC